MTHLSWQGTWKGRFPDGLIHQRARDIVSPTGGIVRGKFPSRKTGRMVHHEGMLELDALYLFEASSLVRSYTEQPETIRYPDGNRLRRYTPDFELLLANGHALLAEVKPRKNAEALEIAHKLSRIADHYGRQGRAFMVLTDDQIRVEPRLASIRWVYHQASRVQPSTLKTNVALRRLVNAFPLSIREATDLLTPVGLDPFSLLMSGALICALDQIVTLDTQLHFNLENHHDWFRIADAYGF